MFNSGLILTSFHENLHELCNVTVCKFPCLVNKDMVSVLQDLCKDYTFSLEIGKTNIINLSILM